MEELVLSNNRSVIYIEEHLGDASERDVTATLNAPGLQRNPSFVQRLDFTNDDPPQYKVVLNGSKNPKVPEADVESASVQTVGFTTTEEIQLVELNTQDSDDIDGDDSSALNFQPSRQNHPHPVLFNHELSKEDDEGLSKEDNEGVTAIKEEPEQLSVEESNREKVDVLVATVLPTECEDNTPAVLAINKAVQCIVTVEPSKQGQQDLAKVLFASHEWKAEFPLNEWVPVEHEEEANNDCFVYTKVEPMDHRMLSKLRQLDKSPHCGTVVAYLEDEQFGYIVKERLEEMATVINKINGRLNIINKDLTKFRKSDHSQTADSMSRWRSNCKEQKRLLQLLNNIITGLITANEFLHHNGFVSMNIHPSNLFVKLNCNCWDSWTCIHGSSAVTVVIGGCELAYQVESMVNGSTKSKALKLLDSMHKYKRAETIYDDFDVATFIIELLTEISGNRDCEKKIYTWISNMDKAIFADPPVEEVLQLLEESGIPQNDTWKIIVNYLKASTAHYARLRGEHEV